MNPLLKSLLLPLLLLLTALPVQAEEKSWYEIDGIRFRPVLAQSFNPIGIYMPWKIEKRISPSFFGPVTAPLDADIARDEQTETLFPFALELPETLMLMTSWSFGGALFEFEFPSEVKDMGRGLAKDRGDGEVDYLRQEGSDRTSLYNDFFNASDKTFADANSNWALSADVTSSRIFLGYTWGVFIPIGEYHRFFKFGAGLGVYYINLSLKLNLCSQLILTGTEGGRLQTECVGKTEIDSYSGKKLGIASTSSMTLWERRTKDSIWRFGSMSGSAALGSDDKGYIRVKLKNHSKSLALWMSSQTSEIISYTYRF